MTKFATILAAAVLVVGFASTGNGVCNNGEIALGHTNGDEYFIYAGGCNYISSRGNYGNICGTYGDSTVNCDGSGNPTTVRLGDGSNWGSCYSTTQSCGADTIDYCCVRQ